MKKGDLLSIILLILICILPITFLPNNLISDTDTSLFISAFVFSCILIVSFIKLRVFKEKYEMIQNRIDSLHDNSSALVSLCEKINKCTSNILSVVCAVKQDYEDVLSKQLKAQLTDIMTSITEIKHVTSHITDLSKSGGRIDLIGQRLFELDSQQKQNATNFLDRLSEVKTNTDTIKSSFNNAVEISMSKLNKLDDESEHQNLFNNQLIGELTYLHSIISQYSKHGLVNNITNVDGDFITSIFSGTEKIVDKRKGHTITSYFDNGVLLKTEMKNQNNDLLFITDYALGKVSHTRNYNEDGKVLTEQSFFDNGQVDTRTEYVSLNGIEKTIVTKFDYYGNIIS